jgi:hypothetical protein
LVIKELILFIITIKSAIQRELDEFFKALSNDDYSLRKITKSAFTQSRAKLNEWAFIRLNEVVADTFYACGPAETWFGMRIMAVDGTRLRLPNHKSIKEEFGSFFAGPKADSECSMALASVCYDVMNQIVVDAQIAPYSSSEAGLLLKHLDRLKENDLLLLDRGYPSFWLLFLLAARKIQFCVRLKEQWWLEAEKLFKSSENEAFVEFRLPKKDRKKLAGYPEMQDSTLRCRLVKIDLGGGNVEILCTSLLDTELFTHEVLEVLYDARWDVEEIYKLLKNRVELEDFSGKTARAVKQDFHAKIFLMSLCAVYAHPIEERVEAEYKADGKRKNDQQINRTNALAVTIGILIPTFVRKKYTESLAAFDKLVEGTREIIRPDRSNPRNHKQKKPYCMNYKRL